ncbi:MAG: 50S ribosomal protein L11 [Candidatus Micrarchaeaceae archaeon]
MAETTINGLIEGGKATTGPPFGPALGPLGVNIGKIIAEINEKTKEFAGIKVPVKVFVNSDTKEYRIEVGMPPTSALILKELGAQKGAKAKEEVTGNISLEQIRKIVSIKSGVLYGRSDTEKIKQIIGTCKSMNVTVEGIDAKTALKKIEAGELKV